MEFIPNYYLQIKKEQIKEQIRIKKEKQAKDKQ